MDTIVDLKPYEFKYNALRPLIAPETMVAPAVPDVYTVPFDTGDVVLFPLPDLSINPVTALVVPEMHPGLFASNQKTQFGIMVVGLK